MLDCRDIKSSGLIIARIENWKIQNEKNLSMSTDRWFVAPTVVAPTVDIYLYDRIWLFKRFGQLIWMNGWMNDAKWICLTSHGNIFRHIHHNWKIIEQCVRENKTREKKTTVEICCAGNQTKYHITNENSL